MTDGSADYAAPLEYVDRASYAALEAHAALLTDQLTEARKQRDGLDNDLSAEQRAHKAVAANVAHLAVEAARLEQERDDAREQLSAAFQQRTRLADLADRMSARATDAVRVADQSQAQAAFAVEQRDAARAERDQARADLLEVTPSFADHEGCLLAVERLTVERDDARKAAREGDRHLADLIDSREIRKTLEREIDDLRSAMIVARDRASAAVQNLADHVGNGDVPF